MIGLLIADPLSGCTVGYRARKTKLTDWLKCLGTSSTENPPFKQWAWPPRLGGLWNIQGSSGQSSGSSGREKACLTLPEKIKSSDPPKVTQHWLGAWAGLTYNRKGQVEDSNDEVHWPTYLYSSRTLGHLSHAHTPMWGAGDAGRTWTHPAHQVLPVHGCHV